MNSTSHCPPIERCSMIVRKSRSMSSPAFSASISPGARMPIPGTVHGA